MRRAYRFIAVVTCATMLATAANAEAPRSRAVKEGDVLTVMLEYQTGTTSTAYRVAVRVIEVQANKVLLIEGHRSWMDSGSVWEYTLSGRVDPKSVSPDGSVLSENITDLSIAKRQRGSSTDSTKYPWIVRLYDWIGPS